MKKTSLKIVAMASVLALFVTACGGGGATTAAPTTTAGGQTTQAGTTAKPAEGTTAAPTDAPKETVEITLMQSKTEIQTDLQTVIDDFNSKDLGVKVTLLGTSGDNYATVLQSNFAADPANAPTVFSMSGVDTVNFQKFFASLDETEAAKILSEGLKPEYMSEEGQLVGLPSAVEGYGFIYNVDMFTEQGIDSATLTDMTAFTAALEKLAAVEGVDAPIGFAMENYFIFIHFFNWAIALTDNYEAEIAEVNGGDKSLADLSGVQAWAAALDQIAPFTNKGQASYDEQVAGFGAGKYAMIHQGNWAQQVLEDNDVQFEYAFLPFPLDGNQGLAVGTATAWRVNNAASAEQQAAGKVFLDWLITSDEGQTWSADTLKFIPAYADVKAPAGGLSESVAEYVTAGQTVPWAYNTVFPAGIDIDGAAYMQEYYAGRLTSAELIEELTLTWQDLAG